MAENIHRQGRFIYAVNANGTNRWWLQVESVMRPGNDEASAEECEKLARLFQAAPELLREARVLQCLASSPRYQHMTVAEALAELALNDCGHDGGAAVSKAL